MRILLWLLLMAVVTLVQSTAMVAARSADSELSKTSEWRASMDQARALSATSTVDQPKPHLRGNDNVDDSEDSKGVSTEEERAFLDGVARLTEKLIGPARMGALRGKMQNSFFKLMRAGMMTPQQADDKLMQIMARKGISDPVKIARIKRFSRNYGLDFVEKADDATFKAMHEKGFGPRYFFKAVKQQTGVDDQKAYLAMAKRYRAWVENNNLKYY